MSKTRYLAPVPIVPAWCGPNVLQFGLTPAVRIQGAPPGLERLAGLLATPRTLEELNRELPELPATRLRSVLLALVDAGLASPAVGPAPFEVRLLGDGRLAGELRARLGRAGLKPPADDQPSALTVVAFDTCEAPREVTDDLGRAARAHLIVRLGGGRGVVGPFVQPGETPCLRCVDLAKSESDRRRFHLIAGLARRPGTAPPLVREWTVLTATAQVLALAAHGTCDVTGRTIELSASDHLLRTDQLRRHPGCRCSRLAEVGTMAG